MKWTVAIALKKSARETAEAASTWARFWDEVEGNPMGRFSRPVTIAMADLVRGGLLAIGVHPT